VIKLFLLAVCAKEPQFRPDHHAIDRIVSYLTAMHVVLPFSEESGRVTLWSDKNFSHFGIEVRSDPATVSIVFSDNPLGDPEELKEAEEWERELAMRSFYIGFSEVVPNTSTGVDDPHNPVWPVIKRLLGEQDLIQLYCST
jgi:hypothetical protein